MSGVVKVGDLVWAKMKGFPPWPGKAVEQPKELKRPTQKKNIHCIWFFGTDNYAWIEENNIKPYLEFKEQFTKNKSGTLRDAVEAIEEYIRRKEADPSLDDETLFGALSGGRWKLDQEKVQNETPAEPKVTAKEKKPRRPKSSGKRSNSETSTSAPNTSNNGAMATTPPVPPTKKPRRSTSADASQVDSLPSGSGEGAALTNHSGYRKPGVVSNFLDRPTGISKPDAVPLDVESVSQTLRDKNIQPSGLKFGFLGLGLMGSGIVKNLLNSGHSVVVWNRTPEKCRDFVKAGAELGMTPSDVILAADVTFSCVADPQAAKDMVFGNCGVLQEVTGAKGYVEMTGVDAETSQDIAEAIGAKGGRYLEAQIQGSKTQAEEGTLVILAAGDRSLFDDCQSCFQAMGKNSFYLGEVGNASKMNLVLQLMAGVTLAGLAEGMALADRAGLQQKDVLEILELTSLACPTIVEKGRAIIEGGFPTHLPLQHMQKDLKLSLSMGDQLEQPLPLTASANEVFKHAKRLGYGEHDVSAVYIRARF